MELQKVFKQIQKWEGTDLESVENDLGGLTNRGITFTNYINKCKAVLGVSPTISRFKLLTEEESFKFYNYMWNSVNIQDIKSNKIKVCLYDFIFNSQFARREIQSFLINEGYEIVADNIFGKQTIAAINSYIQKKGELVVLQSFFKVRENYLKRIVKNKPEQVKFLPGWANRVEDLKVFIHDNIQ